MIISDDKRSKIVIAGGTGALGKVLTDFYVARGWEVVVLTRSARPSTATIRYVRWDGRTIGTLADALTDATAVVNLAGRSINTRFTANRKQEILDSRIHSTAVIGEAISICKSRPKVWINAGGIAIFESSTELKTEVDVSNGTDFLSLVSRRWEAVFSASMTPGTRKIQLRISSVLLSSGGMLSPLVKLTKLGLGGTIGSGNQYISWIHEQDFVKLVDWLIANETIKGIVHASSPNPVTNQDFMQVLRKKVGIRFGLAAPGWATKTGAWLIGTEPGLILSGHRVVSDILRDESFVFEFPEIGRALDNLIL